MIITLITLLITGCSKKSDCECKYDESQIVRIAQGHETLKPNKQTHIRKVYSDENNCACIYLVFQGTPRESTFAAYVIEREIAEEWTTPDEKMVSGICFVTQEHSIPVLVHKYREYSDGLREYKIHEEWVPETELITIAKSCHE